MVHTTGMIKLLDKPLEKLSDGLFVVESREILSELATCGVHEFFNECHAPDSGRFCGGGSGGGGKGEDAQLAAAKKQDDEDVKVSAKKAEDIIGNDYIDYGVIGGGNNIWQNLAITAALAAAIPLTAYLGAQTLGRFQAMRAGRRIAGAPIKKGVYKLTAKNGKILHVLNHSDKLSKKQYNELAGGFKKTYDNDPINLKGNAPTMTIWEKDPEFDGVPGFFVAKPDQMNININRGVLFDFQGQKRTFAQLPHGGTRWYMTSYKTNRSRYVVAQQYGNLRNNFIEDGIVIQTGSAKDYVRLNKNLAGSPDILGNLRGMRGNGLSHKGRSSWQSAYSESYAEWSVTNGKTVNKASLAYADAWDWKIKGYPSAAGLITGTPGQRIVRTPEGAKLFGVPIGQPIPKVEASLDSTGSIQLSAEGTSLKSSESIQLLHLGDPENPSPEIIKPLELATCGVHEFFNECHAPDSGKFCGGGGGGGGWPSIKDDGRSMEEVYESKGVFAFRRKNVDDVPSFRVSEITTKQGNKVRLYEYDKTKASKADKEQILNAAAYVHEIYPRNKTKKIILVNDKTMTNIAGGQSAGVVNSKVPDRILINGDLIRERSDLSKMSKRWLAPSSRSTTLSTYTVMHEMGHQFDFQGKRRSGGGLYYQTGVRQNMGKYANSDPREGYAESFAEWHITKGTTKSPSAISYAQHEGWNESTVGINASGSLPTSEIIYNLFRFAEEDDYLLENDDDTTSIWNPPEDSVTIIDRFDTEAQYIGPALTPATEEELAKAAKIVRRIWKELGMEADTDKDELSQNLSLLATPSSHRIPQIFGLSTCGVHEFFNECHAPDSGRFCGGGSGQGGSKGEKAPLTVNEEPGADLTEKQKSAIISSGRNLDDYDSKGKPIPGTESWRQDHGISNAVYNSRPMVRYEGSKDPAFDKYYEGFPPNTKRFAKSKIASQEDGIIMVRRPVPGAEEAGFGDIPPQVRPDKPIILDNRELKRRTGDVERAETRLANVQKMTPEQIIAERQARVNKTKAAVTQIKWEEAQEIKRPALFEKTKAEKRLREAEKTKDPDEIIAAKKAFNAADRRAQDVKKKAWLAGNDPKRALEIAKYDQKLAEEALDRAKADPQKALKNAENFARNQIVRKKEQLDGVPVKYLFPAGEGYASRVESNQDPQNIKNLTKGKGRVYFIMEGNIKADAALTSVKKEDPKAAVISVPSVTAWSNDEVDWVAQKYLKGREIVLIPDADGIENDNVAKQAVKLAGKLRSNGAKEVIVAAPPTLPGRKGKAAIEKVYTVTGVEDHRKGLDDHLGVGKGTLGDLTYYDTKPPNFDLSNRTGKNTPKDQRFRTDSVKNANKALNAISDLAGERGAGRVSYDAVGAYTGLAPNSAGDSTKLLEKKGVIKIHHIFDPKKLGQGRRVITMEWDEVQRITRRAGVKAPDPDIQWVNDDNKHETAAIIEILDSKYITKPGKPKSLASKYKGLRTSSTTTRPAALRTPSISVSGRRIVRTPEGAKRYGIPIGSEIPEAETLASGTITLSGVTEAVFAEPETFKSGTIILSLITEPVEFLEPETFVSPPPIPRIK